MTKINLKNTANSVKNYWTNYLLQCSDSEEKLSKLTKNELIQNAKFKKIRGISHDMGDYFSNIFANIDLILESVQSKKDKEINKFFNDKDLNLLENLKALKKDINSLSILNIQSIKLLKSETQL
jgi:uncharacterized protein (UPF0305 family)